MTGEKRVLLIEDDEVIQKLIVKLFARRNVDVTVADNPADINKSLENPSVFAMFLIDLVLPGITGWEILRKINKHEDLQGKPVIVLTGAMLSQEEKDKILEQATAVIEKKSFSLPVFDEILDKHL